MVDCGCFKTKLKKEKRRTDEDKTGKQTRDRRRSDGKKIWTTISSIFDSKGVGCAKYEGISVNPCNPWAHLNCSQKAVFSWFCFVSLADAG